MKRNKVKRLIAALLTITISLQALPMQVFAQQPEEPVNTVSSAETEPLIIGEAEDKRTEDTKYFELDDGTTIAAVYAMPVHYQDENGAWQDIDNTLIESFPLFLMQKTLRKYLRKRTYPPMRKKNSLPHNRKKRRL